MKYWLLKAEPETFSMQDLAQRPKQTEPWDGVRNYQARNFMRDSMRVGDLGFFYYSNSKPSGIAGIVKIVKAGYPDKTSWDPRSKYFDPKSTPDAPRWFLVDVQLVEIFPHLLSLDVLKTLPGLENMVLLNNSRLSVQPVTAREWRIILAASKTTDL